MTTNPYAMNLFSLQFRDKTTESCYKDHIFDRTAWFCRIAWGLVVVLGGGFGLLDYQMFGEKANLVLMVRFSLIAIALLIVVLTFSPKFKVFMELSSCVFTLSVGTFGIFLTIMSGPSPFSPYFTGLLYAFTGILSTAGLGFKYSSFALLAILVLFEIAIGMLSPVPFKLMVTYNFFLFSILLIFAYIADFIEIVSRKNYIASVKLYASLSQVKRLSGLLPICASCKKIRDDQGYWKQIESYIRDHSEANFSHSICPECSMKLYPNLKGKHKPVVQ